MLIWYGFITTTTAHPCLNFHCLHSSASSTHGFSPGSNQSNTHTPFQQFDPRFLDLHDFCSTRRNLDRPFNRRLRWQIAGCAPFMGLLLDNEHVCDPQSGGLRGAGGQMTPLSALPPQTPGEHADDRPWAPTGSPCSTVHICVVLCRPEQLP